MATAREMFLPLEMYLSPEEESTVQSTDLEDGAAEPTAEGDALAGADTYQLALERLREPEVESHLVPDLRDAVRALLSVLDTHLRPSPSTHHPFVTKIASPNTSVDELEVFAECILAGLKAFIASGGREGGGAPARSPSGVGFLTSNYSQTAKDRCTLQDRSYCQITRQRGTQQVPLEACHILVDPIKDDKASDFWKFIGMFLGHEKAEKIQAVTLSPRTSSTDCIQNMVLLGEASYKPFNAGVLALVPNLADIIFPYNMATATGYTATVEMPFGSQETLIPVWEWKLDGQGTPKGSFSHFLKPGDQVTFTTTDAKTMPLPHPLLLQLHALVSRVVFIMAGAGCPSLLEHSSESGTCADADSLHFSDNGDWAEEQDWTCGGDISSRKHPIPETLLVEPPEAEIDNILRQKRNNEGTPRIAVVDTKGHYSGIPSADRELPPRKSHAATMYYPNPSYGSWDSGKQLPREAPASVANCLRLYKDSPEEPYRYNEESPRGFSAVMSEAPGRVPEKDLLFCHHMNVEGSRGYGYGSE